MGIPTLTAQGRHCSSNFEKASILNEFFQSVFTKENVDDIPETAPFPFAPKASGPDQIPLYFRKISSNVISPVLQVIYQSSLDTGELPLDWKHALVSPVSKKGSCSSPSNYRPNSLTFVLCKTLEHIIYSNIMSHLDKHSLLSPLQHGFRKSLSCESELILTLHDLTSNFDHKLQTDLILLDFSKTFDSVPHQRLLLKLASYGICGQTLT